MIVLFVALTSQGQHNTTNNFKGYSNFEKTVTASNVNAAGIIATSGFSGSGLGVTNRPLSIFSYALAYPGPAQSIAGASTWTKLSFNTTNISVGDRWFVTNSVFVPLVSGIYYVEASVPVLAANNAALRFRKTSATAATAIVGTGIYSDSSVFVAADATLFGAATFTAGQTYELQIWCEATDAVIGSVADTGEVSALQKISFKTP